MPVDNLIRLWIKPRQHIDRVMRVPLGTLVVWTENRWTTDAP